MDANIRRRVLFATPSVTRGFERAKCNREERYLPVFRFRKTYGIGWGIRVVLNLESGVTREAVSSVEWHKEQYKKQAADLKNANDG
jgi:hypothetical protein